MSIVFNEFDLMEKGEAGELKEATFVGKPPPTSPSTATTTDKSPLSLQSSSEKRSGFLWLARLSSIVSNKRQQTAQHVPQVKGIETVVRSLEECPKGYPRLAAFLDSDENFMLYRRFGFLQARILLYKQDKLRELEEELDAMDEIDAQTKRSARRLTSRERDDAECEDRKNLIGRITIGFNEYVELLKSAHDLASFHRAPARDYESVSRYFNMTNPLKHKESYIHRKEDIITLKPGRENA